jgi:serine/threonine protein kinase
VHGYTSQLLSALAFLHSSAAIHLDLRPEHCLLEADTVTLRLVDLGAAQAVRRGGQGMNMAGSDSAHAGAEFLPPEALGHGPVGPYSDMWAAGVLILLLPFLVIHLLLIPFLSSSSSSSSSPPPR